MNNNNFNGVPPQLGIPSTVNPFSHPPSLQNAFTNISTTQRQIEELEYLRNLLSSVFNRGTGKTLFTIERAIKLASEGYVVLVVVKSHTNSVLWDAVNSQLNPTDRTRIIVVNNFNVNSVAGYRFDKLVIDPEILEEAIVQLFAEINRLKFQAQQTVNTSPWYGANNTPYLTQGT